MRPRLPLRPRGRRRARRAGHGHQCQPGPFCSGSLGYWVAAARTGRGLAARGVAHVLDECFTRPGLHRVEAATLVDNHASQAVLRRTGFTLIGLAPGYLSIAGRWRDHLLFQRLAEDPAPGTDRFRPGVSPRRQAVRGAGSGPIIDA